MCREAVTELVLPVVLDPDQWGAGTGRGGRAGGDPPARAWDSHLVLLLQLLRPGRQAMCANAQPNTTPRAWLASWGLGACWPPPA
jgi:hypothetical protein